MHFLRRSIGRDLASGRFRPPAGPLTVDPTLLHRPHQRSSPHYDYRSPLRTPSDCLGADRGTGFLAPCRGRDVGPLYRRYTSRTIVADTLLEKRNPISNTFDAFKEHVFEGRKRDIYAFDPYVPTLLIIAGIEPNPGPVTLDDIMKKLEDLTTMKADLTNVKEDVKKVLELQSKVSDNTASIVKIKQQLRIIEEKQDMLEKSLQQQNDRQRWKNFIIYNWIPDKEGTLKHQVMKFAMQKLHVELSLREIEQVYFLKSQPGKTKPVLVVFTSRELRAECLRASKNLKGSDIYVKPDVPVVIREVQKELNEYMKKAKRDGQRAMIRYDKLVVNGDEWTIGELRERFESADEMEEQADQEIRKSPVKPASGGTPRTLRKRGRGTSGSSPEKMWRKTKKPTKDHGPLGPSNSTSTA